MPNQRSEGQKLLAFAMESDLLDLMDKARLAIGEDRSTFIRRSIVAKLQADGYEVPDGLIRAPERIGKAGRPRKNQATPPPAKPKQHVKPESRAPTVEELMATGLNRKQAMAMSLGAEIAIGDVRRGEPPAGGKAGNVSVGGTQSRQGYRHKETTVSPSGNTSSPSRDAQQSKETRPVVPKLAPK